MRVLFFSKSISKDEIQEDINFLEKNLEVNVDYFDDLDDAEYCLDIRHYDYVIMEYVDRLYPKYFNIKKVLHYKELQPNVFFFNETKRTNELGFEFKTRDFDSFKNYLLSIIPEDESEFIKKDNIIAYIKTKSIFYKDNEDNLIEIVIEKDFDFKVLLYFIRNYEKIINLKSLLDATCQEPEIATNFSIEASITSIRKIFRKLFKKKEINPIVSLKKSGFKFSMQGIS